MEKNSENFFGLLKSQMIQYTKERITEWGMCASQYGLLLHTVLERRTDGRNRRAEGNR